MAVSYPGSTSVTVRPKGTIEAPAAKTKGERPMPQRKNTQGERICSGEEMRVSSGCKGGGALDAVGAAEVGRSNTPRGTERSPPRSTTDT